MDVKMQTSYVEVNDSDRQKFVANHWLHTECPNGKHLVTRSGILILKDVKGNSGSWLQETILFSPKFPYGILPKKKNPDKPEDEPPEQMMFQIEHWAPLVTLNVIANDGTAMNAGWAVDNFGFNWSNIKEKTIFTLIPMFADIAVRDTDGYLLRIGYSITLVGKFVFSPYPDID